MEVTRSSPQTSLSPATEFMSQLATLLAHQLHRAYVNAYVINLPYRPRTPASTVSFLDGIFICPVTQV